MNQVAGTVEIYRLTVLEAESLKSRHQLGWLLLEAPGDNHFLASFG